MSLRKHIQRYRKALMKKVTRRFASTSLSETGGALLPASVTRVLICRPNHRLGNLLLITPLLQEVEQIFPHARVDLFVKGGLAPVLFSNYRVVGRIIALPKKPLKDVFGYIRAWITLSRIHYDIVINVVNQSSSGRIAAQVARSPNKFLGEVTREIELAIGDSIHMAKSPVYSLRAHLQGMGFCFPNKPVPPLDIRLTAREVEEGRRLLYELTGVDGKSVICLYTYATGEKCYTPRWWDDLHKQLAMAFPGFSFLEVLPIENVSQLSFRIKSFYSRDLRQIASVLTNAAVFIGADSGMMHLASASGVATVGLFQTTRMSVYAPYNRNSLGIDTRETPIAACVAAVGRILGIGAGTGKVPTDR